MAQDRNSNEQLIKLLVEQLRKVAEKLVPRAFGVREVGKKGVRVVELPDLEAIVRANFSDDWDDGRHVDAAQATLKHAILRLDGVFGEKYGIPGELKTKEEIAYRYFNLDGSPRMPHVKPIEFDGIDDEAASGKSYYNKVRSELVKAAGLDVSPATMKRLLQDLRRELAEILVDPAFPIFDEGGSFWTVISPDDPSYITRPEAESWYFNLPASRRKIVSFYGDAGTGKSTIARHLARYLVVDPGRIVVLYADNEDLLVRKMSDVLRERTGQVVTGHRAAVAADFARLLARPEAPAVVIIDNAIDWDAVRLLLPDARLADLTSTVLITSRGKLSANVAIADCHVDNMAEQQAIAMVANRLPGITAEDARVLAKELDYRPLAIEHGCVLIRRASLEPHDFLSMIQADLVELFDAVPTTEMKLTAIYRRIMERITSDANLVLALRLLDLLTVVPARVDGVLVGNAWGRLPGSGPTASVGMQKLREQSLKSATEDLERLSLVTVEDGGSAQNFLMHNLTHAILRRLRAKDVNYAAEAVIGGILFGLNHIAWAQGNPLPHAWMHWTHPATLALESLEVGEDVRSSSPDILQTGAFVLRTKRQWGQTCHHCLQRYAGQHKYRHEDGPHPDHLVWRTRLAVELVSAGWLRYNGPCCPHQDPSGILRDVPIPQLYDPAVGDFWYPLRTLLEREKEDALGEAVYRPLVGNVDGIEDPIEAARSRALNGVVFAEEVLWDEAEAQFEAAFDGLDSRDLNGLFLKYDVVRRAIGAHIQSGRAEALDRWGQRLADLYPQRSDDGYLDDRMVLSQVKRVEGDLGLARLYGAGPDIEKDVETGRQIATLYGKLVQEWWANGCSIFWSPGMYQQGRALAYIGDIHGAHDSFSASYKHSRDVEFSKMGALIARLGLLKINPSREQAIGREYSSIAGRDAQVALEIANDIAMQYGLAYWHADAILLAWILGSLSVEPDMDFVSAIEPVVIAALDRVGRGDRWLLAQRIADRQVSTTWLLAD